LQIYSSQKSRVREKVGETHKLETQIYINSLAKLNNCFCFPFME
jgi:hypothetical protein